jgi:hypothetical protein
VPGQQRVERALAADRDLGIAEQAPGVVGGEHDAPGLERDLAGVGVVAQVAFGDGDPRGGRQGVEPVAQRAGQRVAGRAGPVVELRRQRDEPRKVGTAPRPLTSMAPRGSTSTASPRSSRVRALIWMRPAMP